MIGPRSLRALRSASLVATRHGLLTPAKAFHASASAYAFSKFTMPAMSPTMTEGGLANWKVQEGGTFSAGDVLLEIETDKATMDVEAQDDGVMAKIIVPAGEKNVAVGRAIAILAEEGDDLSQAESQVSLEDTPAQPQQQQQEQEQPQQTEQVPSTRASSSSSAPDTHSASASTSTKSHAHPDTPMFPSVARLLHENSISPQDAAKNIKGTGHKGMLTKGDVLMHLGKVSSPTGTFKSEHLGISALGGASVKSVGGTKPPSEGAPAGEKSKPLTATELRAAILTGLASSSRTSNAAAAAAAPAPAAPKQDTLEAALSDYTLAAPISSSSAPKAPKRDWLEGLI